MKLTHSDSSILPEDMANQSVRLKEEQLRREEEKLREIELKVQREIQIKRQELLAKEDSLKVLEARLGMSLLLFDRAHSPGNRG
jgi:cell division control protein 11